MIINESDINYEKSFKAMSKEHENSYSIFKNNNFEIIQNDFDILKNSILFKNWSTKIFKNFIEDSRVFSKKFKYQILKKNKNNFFNYINLRYKEVIAKEIDCSNNIYILKSGQAKCYIRISRSQIKKHQKTLESHSNSSYFIESNSNEYFLNFIYFYYQFKLTNKKTNIFGRTY